MAQNIGGYAFDIVNGFKTDLMTKTKEWTVNGNEGIASKDLGKSVSFARFKGIKYDTESNIKTLITNMYALKGTVIDCEDSFGEEFTNILVTGVNRVSKVNSKKNGSFQTRVEFQIIGKATD